MIDTVARLLLLAAVFAVLTAGADAQSPGDQRLCAKSKDPVLCMCAMANGGRWEHLPGRTRPLLAIDSEADAARFRACMARKGRAKG